MVGIDACASSFTKKIARRIFEAESGRILRLFEPNEVFESFAAPRESRLPVGDENFGGAKAQVVVGGHHESIGARVADREKVAFLRTNHVDVLRKRVGGLADRTDDVG